MTGTATFSDCGKYRYTLTREWEGGEGTLNFIMLNPSTATADVLDPTVRGCLLRAQEWGYHKLVVTNLFALRSTDPKGLLAVDNPMGHPDNDYHILGEAKRADMVICAWGGTSSVLKLIKDRVANIMYPLRFDGKKLYYLRMSERTGQPWHPLYVPRSVKPVEWKVEG